MRFFDLLKLSLRMFKARTMRTLLTILGMSVGIAAIIFLVSMGYGLQRTLLQKITTSDALVTVDVSLDRADGSQSLNDDTIADFKTLPDVADVIPVLELPSQGKFDTVTLDVNAISSTASFAKNEGLKLEAGKFFSDTERQNIVISSAVTRVFNISSEEILGKSV